MSSTAIVAVIYEEPEYEATRESIGAASSPTVWADRQGVGSLAAAYNCGFRQVAAMWGSAPSDVPKNPMSARLESVRMTEAGGITLLDFHKRLLDGWTEDHGSQLSYPAARTYHRYRDAPVRYLARVAEVFDVRLEWLATGRQKRSENGSAGPEFVWFVSNVTFTPDLLPRLVESLRARPNMAAIHPAFCTTNHPHQKPNGTDAVEECAFVEFTCPLVRADVFARFPLDEAMPYWGHDLDWGWRVRQAGYTVGVDHGAPEPGHEYIWAINEHPVTRRRKALRAATNGVTKMRLVEKYGPDWMRELKYFGPPVSA